MGNANSGTHAKDLSGMRFGKLVVKGREGYHFYPSGQKTIMWFCECDCGRTVSVAGDSLRKGNTASCGCLKQAKDRQRLLKHGHSYGAKRERLYTIWLSMRDRTRNPNNRNFRDYGGRGITVCEDWNHYENFREWALCSGYDATAKYGKCTLDRINNDKGYSPENCRWVDFKTQANNKRNTRRGEV